VAKESQRTGKGVEHERRRRVVPLFPHSRPLESHRSHTGVAQEWHRSDCIVAKESHRSDCIVAHEPRRSHTALTTPRAFFFDFLGLLFWRDSDRDYR
jgi:hypothetical protein